MQTVALRSCRARARGAGTHSRLHAFVGICSDIRINTYNHSIYLRSYSSVQSDTVMDFNFMNTLDHVGQQALAATNRAAADPEKISAEVAQAAKSACLLTKQLHIEEKQHENAVKDYVESLARLMKNGNASGLRHIQAHVLSWFEPLMKHVEAEQLLVKMKIPGFGRDKAGPILLLLPVDKLAVVTINTTLNQILRSDNSGVSARNLALQIGQLLQLEFNVLKAAEGENILTKWHKEQIKLAQGNERRVHALARQMGALVSQEQWGIDTCIHLGSSLLSMLIQTAKNKSGDPCFSHMKAMVSEGNGGSSKHSVGMLQMEADMYKEILDRNLETLTPQFLPMVVTPKPWTVNVGRIEGGFYRLDCDFMRTGSNIHLRSLLRSDIGNVMTTLDYISGIKWSINKRVRDVAAEAYATGDLIGELPSKENLEIPREADFATPEGEVDLKAYKKMERLVTKTNAEMHSLRCDVEIKLNIAKDFGDDIVYFPCNLDFRGRVYPIPPNLNHLGSDLCRGLLLFAEPKALGENGLNWLKIHLCNLFGNNKISLESRRDWADENIDAILDSAADPLHGGRWWTTAESPFQALACCMEIKAALDSGDPSSYRCPLPVHQDGSCNGLQHYAALGRDAPGALAVNLMTGEKDRPGDVYTSVLEIVNRKIIADTEKPDSIDPQKQLKKDMAVFLNGRVNRKVIKQTVMTSVYGVTALGARDQILARLIDIEKKDLNGAPLSPEILEKNKLAASYLAKITLASLGEMFKSADKIMKWLGDCASLISKSQQVMSWITPLGLPVMQPYRKKKNYEIKTVLQTITLASQKESLPVCPRKQKTAFPPNFVHSLDASHMLLTAMHMKENNLTFAAVHDSYWTYASDVPIMNEALRHSFVELYEQPVLESVYESCKKRYPTLDFPPIPQRGELNINDVLNSRYFFH